MNSQAQILGAIDSDPKEADRLCLTAFSFLWALSILFQYQSQLSWYVALERNPAGVNALLQSALLASACALLIQPKNWYALLTVAVLQVLQTIWVMPDNPNHRYFFAAMNCTLLLTAALLCLKRNFSPELLWKRFAPVAQFNVVCLYLFATFAKLNSDFLNVEASCVTIFYRETLTWYSFLPNGRLVEIILGYLTLIIEFSIPVLLACGKRLGLFGLCLGLIFHFVLALDIDRHFFDFSSVLFASYSVFVGASFWCSIVRYFGEGSTTRNIWLRLYQVFFLGIYLYVVICGTQSLRDVVAGQHRLLAMLLLWQVSALIGIILVVFTFLKSTAQSVRWNSQEIYGLLWIIPVVVALNGAAPYLGIKSRSSWDMYTNMRIENYRSNHLIMPHSFDLLGWMGNPVALISTTNPEAAIYTRDNWLLTHFEARRLIQDYPSERFVFMVDGRAMRYPEEPKTKLYFPDLPWIVRKLFGFAPSMVKKFPAVSGNPLCDRIAVSTVS